ncbi:hypothetical protein GTY68_13030 [Streptomyces sp. SID4926]|nr:hypothetical protein SSBG_06653 [Streptomyces sp. SPB074]EFK98046.1 conserved hypothetical protein [Streptomyces sp. SPB78]MYQ58138.1 hypothetical protein [Streptomyces sp. SID4926]
MTSVGSWTLGLLLAVMVTPTSVTDREARHTLHCWSGHPASVRGMGYSAPFSGPGGMLVGT